ncbi:hypothetical protein ELQ90_16085 [Labedella phragmitis]|uniref:Uncharacterized protein n=1 Tax=Labedella phragmitis TaxID=2498849 RepID=A0A3S3ZHF7_9MICO|nr:hypothetical protein [Labedella phragmitis]RWZ46143.1 hypothetical protein ELQ90_16085 [Labedella phragmitis]
MHEVPGASARDLPAPASPEEVAARFGRPVFGLVPQPHVRELDVLSTVATGEELSEVSVSYSFLAEPGDPTDPRNLVPTVRDIDGWLEKAERDGQPEWFVRGLQSMRFPMVWEAVRTTTRVDPWAATTAERLAAHMEHVLLNTADERQRRDDSGIPSLDAGVTAAHALPANVAVDGAERPGIQIDTDATVIGPSASTCGSSRGGALIMRADRGVDPMPFPLVGDPLVDDRRGEPTPGRLIAAIAATALLLWVALTIGGQAAVVLMFGGMVGLAVLAVAVAVACATVAIVLSALTGRRRIGAAIAVTLLAFVATAVGLVGFGSIPMIWVGFELVHLIVAVLSALVLGLFLEPLWLRIVGALSLVALIVAGAVLLAPENAEPEPSPDALQAQVNFEYFIENGTYPMVADLPGATLAGHPATGEFAHTLMITEDGGVLDIVREAATTSNPDITPCWYLIRETLPLEQTDTLADYASWCVKEGDVWRMVDGTGLARMEDGDLIAVRPAFDPDVANVGGSRPANADEIAAAWATLRPMTEAEVRRHVQWPGVE